MNVGVYWKPALLFWKSRDIILKPEAACHGTDAAWRKLAAAPPVSRVDGDLHPNVSSLLPGPLGTFYGSRVRARSPTTSAGSRGGFSSPPERVAQKQRQAKLCYRLFIWRDKVGESARAWPLRGLGFYRRNSPFSGNFCLFVVYPAPRACPIMDLVALHVERHEKTKNSVVKKWQETAFE